MNIVNFFNSIYRNFAVTVRIFKIKSAIFTNFRPRVPLFSEYYEKFKNLYFLD